MTGIRCAPGSRAFTVRAGLPGGPAVSATGVRHLAASRSQVEWLLWGLLESILWFAIGYSVPSAVPMLRSSLTWAYAGDSRSLTTETIRQVPSIRTRLNTSIAGRLRSAKTMVNG